MGHPRFFVRRTIKGGVGEAGETGEAGEAGEAGETGEAGGYNLKGHSPARCCVGWSRWCRNAAQENRETLIVPRRLIFLQKKCVTVALYKSLAIFVFRNIY